MRRFLSILLVSTVALCAPSVLSAQQSDNPKVELFSGFSGYRAGGTFNGVKQSNYIPGWSGQLILRSTQWTGLLLDFSSHSDNSASAKELAFGLRLQKSVSRFVPFVDALAGFQEFAPKGLPSQLKTTWIAGGGVDVKLTSRLSARPIEISWVGASYNTMNPANSSPQLNAQGGVRVQAGLIYSLRWPSPAGSSAPPAPAEVPNEVPKEAAKAQPTPSAPVTPEVAKAQPTSSAPVAPEIAKAQPTPSASVTPEVAKAQPASSAPVAPEATNADNASKAEIAQTPTKAPMASVPQSSKFGAILFTRDLKRPTRIDNEAKAELDRYADALAFKPDFNGIVVGYAANKKSRHSQQVRGVAGQRAVNAKDYLTKNKGIDPARIEPRIGRGNYKKAELWIVPPGNRFAVAGTTVVDESKVKPIPRIALKARNPRTKKRKAAHKSH